MGPAVPPEPPSCSAARSDGPLGVPFCPRERFRLRKGRVGRSQHPGRARVGRGDVLASVGMTSPSPRVPGPGAAASGPGMSVCSRACSPREGGPEPGRAGTAAGEAPGALRLAGCPGWPGAPAPSGPWQTVRATWLRGVRELALASSWSAHPQGRPPFWTRGLFSPVAVPRAARCCSGLCPVLSGRLHSRAGRGRTLGRQAPGARLPRAPRAPASVSSCAFPRPRPPGVPPPAVAGTVRGPRFALSAWGACTVDPRACPEHSGSACLAASRWPGHDGESRRVKAASRSLRRGNF